MKANKDSQLANTLYRVNAFKSMKKVRRTANHNQLRYILAGQEVIGDPGIVIDDLTHLFIRVLNSNQLTIMASSPARSGNWLTKR